MTDMRTPLACAMLALLPVALHGQASDGGRFELGAFATYSRYDPTRLQLSRDYGVGVRAGWFPTSVISVEALGSRTHTRHAGLGAGVVASELGATALATVRAGGYNQLFAGVGYSWLSYSKASGSADQAVHVVIGDRVPLSRMSALRLEARATRTASSNAFPGPGGKALSLSLSAGVSLFLGARPPRDSDADVVPDRFDACPATPATAVVDAAGCPRDGDADGLPDGLDRCVGTPRGAAVDAVGCVPDTDSDGVPDYLDRCPATGDTDGVGQDGCPTDGDGDGVRNDLDRCLDTPAGVPVDGAGCPRDTDSDGVPDHIDRCAATPAGQPIDGVGCTLLFEERAGERVPLVLRGVNFEVSQAVLTPDSYSVLDQVAASLVANPEVSVEVAGHTDASGPAQRNALLSVARAETVRDYLIAGGVSAGRLVARGYGADEPVSTNGTEEGRAQNRRVELRLIER